MGMKDLVKNKKRQRNKDPKRDSILSAAVQAFMQEGYDKTSMDKIAEVAGASKRTVYNHFTSKEELFQAVVEKFLGEQQSLKQIRYDSTRSLEEQISEFIDAELFLINDATRLGLSKVLTSVFLFDNKLAIETRKKYATQDKGLLDWLRAAQKDGKIKLSDPVITLQIFYGMVQGTLTWPALFQGISDAKKLASLKSELIATFLSQYRR